jgi:hypothetical protein
MQNPDGGHGPGTQEKADPKPKRSKDLQAKEDQMRLLHQFFGPEYCTNRQILMSVFVALLLGTGGGLAALAFFNSYDWGSQQFWDTDEYHHTWLNTTNLDSKGWVKSGHIWYVKLLKA